MMSELRSDSEYVVRILFFILSWIIQPHNEGFNSNFVESPFSPFIPD